MFPLFPKIDTPELVSINAPNPRQMPTPELTTNMLGNGKPNPKPSVLGKLACCRLNLLCEEPLGHGVMGKKERKVKPLCPFVLILIKRNILGLYAKPHT